MRKMYKSGCQKLRFSYLRKLALVMMIMYAILAAAELHAEEQWHLSVHPIQASGGNIYPPLVHSSLIEACSASDNHYIAVTEHFGHKYISHTSSVGRSSQSNRSFYCGIKITRLTKQAVGGYAPQPDVWGMTGAVYNSTAQLPDNAVYNIDSGEYEYPEKSSTSRQLGVQNPQSCATPSSVGNSINIATGNVFQVETDMVRQSNSPLRLKRYFNSANGKWSISYTDRLITDRYTAVLRLDNGRQVIFNLSGETATPIGGDTGTLEKTPKGWRYRDASHKELSFDEQGRLVRLTEADGQVITLSYPDYETIKVQDANLNTLIIQADLLITPKKVTSPFGFSIVYLYDATGRLAGIKKNSQGLLSTRSYRYESRVNGRLLTGIIDENGALLATWDYDDQARAVASEHASGTEKSILAYNSDGSTTVTNSLGKKTNYQYQVIQGVKRITSIEGEPSANCPNSNSTFTYNERGLLKTKTDNKGHLTTYDYNARGLEVSRTEASGTPQARTITTDWHSTLFLPTVVTEPDRITRYQYDDQGRQLSRTVEAR